MKKLFLFAVAAVALTVACSKQPGDSSSATGGSFELESPVPVQFATNVGRVTTKGNGALDGWAGTESLYFFGIERLKDQQGADSLDMERPFISNVPETAPAGTSGSITLYNPAVGSGHEEPYYYGSGNYEFFGYYLDNAGDPAATVLRTDPDTSYVTHITIDGTQDVLVGYADRDTVVNRKGRLDPPVVVNKERLFSAYAIRKWSAKPEMLFKHKLSRFDFYIRSGEAEAENTIKVAGIRVESNTEADLVVAGKHIYDGLKDVQNPQNLVLQIKDGADLVPLTPDNAIPAPAYDAEHPDAKDLFIDGSLLVMPGQQTYKLELTLTQDNASVPGGQPQSMVIDFNKLIGGTSGNKFAEPGYAYKIILVVYKYPEVEILVSLEEWKEGGSVVWDPDAE